MKIKFQAILDINAALKAVEGDGYALQFVKDQTEAICLKAVEMNGYALRYVMEVELFIKIAAMCNIDIEM